MLEILRQVPPTRVYLFDQRDFLVAAPSLDLLLAFDGAKRVVSHIEVDQALGAVSSGEAGDYTRPVLREPSEKVVRDTGVKDSGDAGEDVDVIRHCAHILRGPSHEVPPPRPADACLWSA